MSISRFRIDGSFFEPSRETRKKEWGYTYTVGTATFGVTVGSSFSSLQDELTHMRVNRPDAAGVKVFFREIIETPWKQLEMQ